MFRGYHFFEAVIVPRIILFPRVLLVVPRVFVRGYQYLFCRCHLEKSVISSDVLPRIMLFPRVLGSVFVNVAEDLVVCSSVLVEGSWVVLRGVFRGFLGLLFRGYCCSEGTQCSFLSFISG